MVGAAVLRQLLSLGVAPERVITRDHDELDLADQPAVRAFFAAERPNEVYPAAARVGGIHANDRYPVESIYQNMMI